MQIEQADVIIVGAGPAGLAGAVHLARCRARVLVFDTGQQRNLASQAMHGYLTQEGIRPEEWLRSARAEATHFGAIFIAQEVRSVEPTTRGFDVCTSDARYHARKVLMATGVRDRVPELPGFQACYGTSVFHCPYCDGWEVRDKSLAAFGERAKAAPLALKLRGWSAKVTLYTNGPVRFTARQKDVLDHAGITVRSEPVAGLIATGDQLQAVELRTGEQVACDALFFANGHTAGSSILADLGCTHLRTGEVITDRQQRTRVPGLFVAGDADIDIHFVSVACAEGAKAAVAIHQELQDERGWSWP